MPHLKTYTLTFITCMGVMSSPGCIPEQRRGADPPVLIEDDPVDASADTRRPLDAGDAGDAGGAGDAADVADVADVADAGGAADTDAAPSCEDECEQAGSLCDGVGATRSCGQFDEDPCLDLGEPSACSETQACDGGECVATCADECASGETSCGADGGTLSCGNFDADACLEWGGASACGASERCEEGACVPTADPCVDTCQADGDVVCSGVFRRTCGQHDSDSCLELGPVRSCPAGQECQGDGSCVPSCADECARGASRCLSGGVATCGQFDSDACLDLSSPSPCGAGYACQSGACVQTCVDECPAVGDLECYGATSRRVCGDYDLDSCLEWSSSISCLTDFACDPSTLTCEPIDVPALIVINELVTDHPGSDTAAGTEVFIELFGPADEPLDGWTLEAINGSNGSTYRSIDLTGQALDPSGYFVIAHPAASPALLAVADMTTPQVDLQNGPDSLELRRQGQVEDAVGYGVFGGSDVFAGEGAAAAAPGAGEALSRDGLHADTDDNATDFAVYTDPTPGGAPLCADECALGVSDCVTGGLRTCGDYDADLCVEWSSPSACAASEACVVDACVPTGGCPGGCPPGLVCSQSACVSPDACYQQLALTCDVFDEAYIKASNTGSGDHFGSSIALDGDTLVVGAMFEDTTNAGSGAAYVYTRTGSTWSFQAMLKASNARRHARFGSSVAIDGDRIVVGAPSDGGDVFSSTYAAGSVFVFERTGTSWSEVAALSSSTKMAGFGRVVSLSGDRLAVGSPGDYRGKVDVYERSSSGAWLRSRSFVNSGPSSGANDFFGSDVSIDGDTLVVGSRGKDAPSLSDYRHGGVFFYERSLGGSWLLDTPRAGAYASNADLDDGFGVSVDVDGDVAVVGAPGEDGSFSVPSSNTATDSGAAYVFRRGANQWFEEARLKASDLAPGDEFGEVVAISGDLIAIGATGEDGADAGLSGHGPDTASNSGAVYLFEYSAGAWTQIARIKASNTAADDLFGFDVALGGDTLAASALGEDSAATGVGGDQSDDSVSSSGAAYVRRAR